MSGTTTTTRTVGALPAVTTLPAGSEVVALVADATVSGGKAARRAPASAFQGTAGTAGATGARGASALTGTGVPAASLGANGDSYVDGATGLIYQKASGAWTQVSGASLRGPTGPAGSGTGGTTFDPAALPVGTALSASDEGVIIQGGAGRRATLGAISTAAGISPTTLPVSGTLTGPNELMLTQAGSVTRLTLDALVTYLQGRLGTTGGGGGTTTPTAPTWTLRADYVPSGGLTAYGAVPGFRDQGQSWRVSADNRLESNSTWIDPWVNNYLIRSADTLAINQRLQARFMAAAATTFHLYARATGDALAINGLVCSVQPAGWFRVDPIVSGVRGDLAGADGTVTLTPGTIYDLRADVIQNGASTNVVMALFSATAGTALCSGTQLSGNTVAYTGTTSQNTAGTAGMFWFAETENTPTFVDRFAWYAG